MIGSVLNIIWICHPNEEAFVKVFVLSVLILMKVFHHRSISSVQRPQPKKETFLRLDFITTYPVVLLRLKINLRHIQEVNVSTHTRIIISNRRMNEEHISIYEVGTKGRITWTEVCNSKRESSHVR